MIGIARSVRLDWESVEHKRCSAAVKRVVEGKSEVQLWELCLADLIFGTRRSSPVRVARITKEKE